MLKYFIAKVFRKFFIPAIKNSKLDRKAKVCSFSNIINSVINRYSYVGYYCNIINTSIGAFSSIADNCIIGGAMHPIDWVSTSPVFCAGKNILSKNFYNHPFNPSVHTIIGNDVWIGNNCLIKQGVTVGDGAIIGMGSVVTKDILPYSIVAGNPARVIRMRFNDEIIDKLKEINWTNFSETKIYEQGYSFKNIVKFIQLNDDRFSDKR